MKGIIYLTLGIILFSQMGNAVAVGVTREDTLLQVLTYGYSIKKLSAAQNLIAQKYGFYYHFVGGCTIPPELIDSINRENDITYGILEKRHGKGWQDRYNAALNELLCYLEEVEALVEKEPYIIQKQRQLQQNHNNLYLDVMPMSPDGRRFDVSASSWNGTTETHYFDMEVDAVTRTVKLISQKPEEK